MDPSRASTEAHSLAERLISLDPVEYDSVINEYFESNVTYTSRGVILHGVSKLKKYLSVGSKIAFESHLVGSTHYNSHNQTAHFAFQRTFYLPTLPTFLPLAHRANAWLNKQHFKAVFDSELHLNGSKEAGEQTKLYVTKVGPTTRRGATVFEQLIPYTLLQPIITFLVLALATVIGFFNRHKQDTYIHLAFAALAESWAGLTGQPVQREYPRPIQQAQTLTDKFGKVVNDAIGNANQTTHDLTKRAKELGLPIEQGQQLFDRGLQLPGNAYNTAQSLANQALNTVGSLEQQSYQTAQNIANGAFSLATDTAEQLEAKAKELGIPVEQYKELAMKNAQEIAEWFGVKKAQAGQKADEVRNAAQHNHMNGPATVTGTATYAEATAPDMDPVPRVSTGGHDPTAANAPSYAQAAH
ncbi:hypothetical protein IAU60_000041 [Kwoniella sp. DSM 27419]